MIVEKLADELKVAFQSGPPNPTGTWLAVARRAKELLGDKPPINVLVKEDGTWLEFHGDGKTSLIRLETLAEGPISRTALKAWCRDYRAGATATPILGVAADKPVATREGVIEFMRGRMWSVEDVLAAITHFAPPRQRVQIQGMSEAQIEAEMFISLEEKRKRMEGVIYVQECARVAHRLANTPAPEVDPDARAKAAAWAWAIALEPDPQRMLYANKDDNWHVLSERHRNGWRAVAAMEKGGE